MQIARASLTRHRGPIRPAAGQCGRADPGIADDRAGCRTRCSADAPEGTYREPRRRAPDRPALRCLAQSRINRREAHGRHVVSDSERAFKIPISRCGFIAASGHGIAIAHLTVQQRSALHLRGIGKMRDRVGELPFARVGHAQTKMRQPVIGGQPRDQRMLSDGFVKPVANAIHPSQNEIGEQARPDPPRARAPLRPRAASRAPRHAS